MTAENAITADVSGQPGLSSLRQERGFGQYSHGRANHGAFQETLLVLSDSEVGVESQQSRDLSAEVGFAATSPVQEGAALFGGQVGCLGEQGPHAQVVRFRHRSPVRSRNTDSLDDQGAPSARRSANQARAQRQSRFNVLIDTPRTLAVSSTLSPV